MRVCDTTAFQTRFGETASRTQLAAPPGSTAPRARQFGGKIVSFLFLTRIFPRKSGQPGDLFLNRLHMRPNGVSDASRSTAKFHCPQAPAIWGKNASLVFFFDENFSRKSGQPGQARAIWGQIASPFFLTRLFSRSSLLNRLHMRPNGVSDASRSTAKFHCPQAPAIWGENCEPCFFF